jgi:hypothetical protein
MKKIQFTKEGKRFLIAVVLMGFASLNTGNNLIYLLLSMMLSITLISFDAVVIKLKGIAVQLNSGSLFTRECRLKSECPYRTTK